VGDQRTFDNDPRFGLVVLAEIADRALSPAVNDPGTAIDVIGTLTRLLCNWKPDNQQTAVKNDRVAIPRLEAKDLLEDAIRPIARNGAGLIEVVLRLLNGLKIVAQLNPHFRQAALAMVGDAVGRAERALTTASDLHALECTAAFASTKTEPACVGP